MIAKEKLLEKYGYFFHSFSDLWLIECTEGNFIWSDPEYGGDNTICKTDMDIHAFNRFNGLPYARNKGLHNIERYCGSEFRLVPEIWMGRVS